MDSADLRMFEAVARLGAMNRAAAALNTVQSNVTARIRLLEERLGAPLFERHSRGVSLTPAGQRLLPYAVKVGALLVEAERAARDQGPPQGPLVLGTLETTAAIRLSPVVAAFVVAHPAVDLSLRTGTTCELVSAVLDRQMEAALVCGPVQHPELTEESVFAEELVLVAAPGTASLGAALGGETVKVLVLRAGCSYRQRLEEILARRGVIGARVMEFGTIQALLGCAAAGLGVTMLPEALAATARAEGRVAVHRLAPAEARVETVVVRRRDGHSSRALSAFLDALRPGPAHDQAAE